jgi:hypothetical protein
MPSLFYFIVLVALFFSTIQLSVSFLGGWREIARQFPARRQTASRSFSLQNGCVGEFSYKACLSVHTSVEGISVGILFPFRLGHPPFFIPWSAIHNVVTLESFWSRSVRFDIGNPKIGSMSLPRKVFECYESRIGPRS